MKNKDLTKKLNLIILILLFLFMPIVIADLSDYPGYFIEDNKLNVIIVVGDKAPSTHVLAQTQIILSLSKLVSEKPSEIAKLASEIDNISEKNIISIGNACVNKITNAILKSPEPCDKGLEKGKAIIEMYVFDDKVHIVVNAVSEEGIKKAADVLSNYENYNLEGEKYEIDVEELEEENSEVETDIDEINQVKDDKKLNDKSEDDKSSEELKEEDETKELEKNAEEDKESIPNDNKSEKNLIQKFISWFLSLFK